MDYFKEKVKSSEEFLKNPRKAIIELLNWQNNYGELLISLSMFKSNPQRLQTYIVFRKKYSELLEKMIIEGTVDGTSFKDDTQNIKLIQSSMSWVEAMNDYFDETKPKDVTSLGLARCYASALENFWKKMKYVIFLSRVDTKTKHMTVGDLRKNFEKLEQKYSVDLQELKDLTTSELRNSVEHEDILFRYPDIIEFHNTRGNTLKIIASHKVNYIYESLIKISIILFAITDVEALIIISSLKPLLALTDEELKLYMASGTLTDEMQKKVEDDIGKPFEFD